MIALASGTKRRIKLSAPFSAFCAPTGSSVGKAAWWAAARVGSIVRGVAGDVNNNHRYFCVRLVIEARHELCIL